MLIIIVHELASEELLMTLYTVYNKKYHILVTQDVTVCAHSQRPFGVSAAGQNIYSVHMLHQSPPCLAVHTKVLIPNKEGSVHTKVLVPNKEGT